MAVTQTMSAEDFVQNMVGAIRKTLDPGESNVLDKRTIFNIFSQVGMKSSEHEVELLLRTSGALAGEGVDYVKLFGYLSTAATETVTVRGSGVADHGVLTFTDADNKLIWLTYRESTRHWLVVYTSMPSVPTGFTLNYPNDVDALALERELRLDGRSWARVIPEAELREAVAQAQLRIPSFVSEGLANKAQEKELVILFGVPGAGKTYFAEHLRPDLKFNESVQIVQDNVVSASTEALLSRLIAARQGALTDHCAKEAFLIESLDIYASFMDVASQVQWKGQETLLQGGLERGLRLVTETTGAGLGGVNGMIEKAKAHGYKVKAFYLKAPLPVIMNSIEHRFDKELQQGRVLGGRRFDAVIHRWAAMAEENWPKLTALCDESEISLREA